MLRRTALAAVATAIAVIALPGIAQAKFTASGSGGVRVQALTLRNAGGFAAACASNTPGSAVNLTWTASPDAFVTSYVITRTGTGAGAAKTITVAANVTSTSDSPANPAGNTYSYSIVAKVQNWTTAASAPSSVSYTDGGGGNKCI